MPDWQITMNQKSHFFAPSPRRAMLGDNLYWTNNTDDTHLPWPLDSNGQPSQTGWGLKDIPPEESSDPVPVPGDKTGVTIKYYCQLHPQSSREHGEIQVVSEPPTE